MFQNSRPDGCANGRHGATSASAGFSSEPGGAGRGGARALEHLTATPRPTSARSRDARPVRARGWGRRVTGSRAPPAPSALSHRSALRPRSAFSGPATPPRPKVGQCRGGAGAGGTAGGCGAEGRSRGRERRRGSSASFPRGTRAGWGRRCASVAEEGRRARGEGGNWRAWGCALRGSRDRGGERAAGPRSAGGRRV